jgi:tRNA splicing endonuclease
MIRRSRSAIHELEDIYVTGTAELFNSDDPMNALRKREVYHHLRDAGRALRSTADTLHTVVVGLN